MNQESSFKRKLAWVLIAALVNPAASLPVWAQVPPPGTGDFIIYNSTASSGASEPNILMILDTSDSMNYPEAWREYDPNTYDSHVEYLWNDLTRIVDADAGSGSEATTENATKISTAAVSSTPFSQWGFWTGTALTDRQNLWQAARVYAKATRPGDPGARSTWRNYDDLSWLYWLPSTATEDTDLRLTSQSWNRFRGYIQQLGNGSGGSQNRGGVGFTDTNDYRNYNQCNTSLTDLTPSTVFAPSATPQNAGKYENQQWARWEPYVNLTTVNVAGYPGLSTSNAAGGNNYARGTLDATVAPSAAAGTQTNNPVYRDTYPCTASSCSGTRGSQGLPVRYNSGTAGASWDDVKADLGGFIFQSTVNGYSSLTDFRSIMDFYGLPATTDVDTSGATNITDAKFIAWKGNRDGAAAFGSVTGVPAYYDDTAASCIVDTGPLLANRCVGPVTIGGTSSTTVTATRNCAWTTPPLTEVDARGTTRYRNGVCGATGTTSCTPVGDPNCPTELALTPACASTTSNTFYNLDYRTCAWTGRSSVTVPTCAWSGQTTLTVGTCAWSGRSISYVEGVGYFASGGTCSEGGFTDTCSGNTASIGPFASSALASASTTNCSNSRAPGSYKYGGSCTSAVPSICAVTGGVGPYTIHGVSNTFNRACGNTAGNTPGTYQYGGTCQGNLNTTSPIIGGGNVLTGPATGNCTTSGVTPSQVILGTTYTNVGGSCNDRTDNDQTCATRYGTACTTACNNQTHSGAYGGSAGTTAYFKAYRHGVTTLELPNGNYLVHDCKADEPAQNTGGNSYMRAATSGLRTFKNPWTNTASTASATASYSTNSGHAIPADSSRNINVYSVNYLNWKFGAKACRDAATGGNLITTSGGLASAVVCNPIGRKTRLQIAKDALTDLAATTNGVRFGLEVFNKTATDYTAEGGNIAYKITTMGPKNCLAVSPTTTGSINTGSAILTIASNPGFGTGNIITVPGAGVAGSNLSATILSITGTTITLNTNASTTVASVTIAVPACSGAYTDVYPTSTTEWAAFNNRQTLKDKINILTAASRTPLTESMYEAYRYFRGEAPVFGRLTTTALSTGAVAAGCDKTAFATPGAGGDCTGSSGSYISPMASTLDPNTLQPAACQKNFIILMTDGGPEEDFSANTAIKALNYPGATGTVSPDTTVDQTQADTASRQFEDAGVPYGPVDLASTAYDGGYIWLDELAYYMANSDMNSAITGRQPVITYTIGFAGANTPVLQQAASRSGGNNYVANNSDELAAALTAAVAAIREWNPTVSAPTVPVSSLNRTESGSEVYLAFFGPTNSQAWDGTIKQFRFGDGETLCGRTAVPDAPIDLCLIGKTVLSGSTVKNIEKTDVDPITNEPTTVVNPAAVSFWNPSNNQDGSKPNVGGSGQRIKDLNSSSSTIPLPTPAIRKLYTFISEPGAPAEAVSTSANLLDATNSVSETNTSLITKRRLGNAAMGDTTRATLINFIRGGDVSGADPACIDSSSATLCNTWRNWAHGDVLHSKPAIVTYDPTPIADPEDGTAQLAASQYLFYLSNEGLLHAVNAATGAERWSFLVEEAMQQIVDVKNNLAAQHLTLADGAPSLWVYDANDDGIIGNAVGEKALLFFGLRRGGRVYYALDVSDINAPRLLWKISNTKRCLGATCAATSDFAEMGYSWSQPFIGKVRAMLADPTVPMVAFGGGYDANQDGTTIATADSMGRGVFFIRGDTSAVLRSFTYASTAGMDFSIPSDLALMNADLDEQNLLDRGYVGDMAANLWRFDIDDANPVNWTAKKLAELSNPFTLPTTTPNRKILFAPAMVKQKYLGQRYDAVYVGTGDREHPLNPVGSDKMFMIKDLDVGTAASVGAPVTFPGDLVNITTALTESDFTTALGGAAWNTKTGWYLDLASGEKAVTAPTIYSNILRFATFSPNLSISACVPPGKGVVYGMNAIFGGTVPGTYTTGTPQQMRQYIGFVSRGYPPPGILIVRNGKMYWVVCGDGKCDYQLVGAIGGGTQVYWHREASR